MHLAGDDARKTGRTFVHPCVGRMVSGSWRYHDGLLKAEEHLDDLELIDI